VSFSARFKQNVWHVDSTRTADALCTPKRATLTVIKPRVPLSVQPAASPDISSQLPPKPHQLNSLNTEGLNATVTDPVHFTRTETIPDEFDNNLAPDLRAATSNEGVGEPGKTERKSFAGIMEWLQLRRPKKRPTDMSGAAQFEKAWAQRHSNNGGGNERETDVLEVWFAGCHCGEFWLKWEAGILFAQYT
jgi:hypothetical protein